MIFLTYLSMAVYEIQAYRKRLEEEENEKRRIRAVIEEQKAWSENYLARAREAERQAAAAKEADRIAAEAARKAEEEEEMRKIRIALEREINLARAIKAERQAAAAKEADHIAAEAASQAVQVEAERKDVAVAAADVKAKTASAKQSQVKNNKSMFGGMKKGFML